MYARNPEPGLIAPIHDGVLLSYSLRLSVHRNDSDHACGCTNSDCWLEGGSVIKVPPCPSLTIAKLDAAY